MSVVDLSSSPIIHPTIREDGEELDETTDIPDQASTPSDIFSERSRVWLARHGEAVHSRISSSKQKFTGVVNKKTLKDFESEKATVFMETTQQLSYDVLATEFLSQNYTTIDTRIYLLDKLIPCLAFSLQRLLLQVVKLGVVDKDIPESGFNPVNFLAQQLMRNNPRYNPSSESSPYGVGIRLASDEMRRRLFAMEESRLAKIKADALARRREREKQKELKKQREAYRYTALESSYQDWLIVGLTNIPKSPIYSALTSFQERIADASNISTEHFSFPDREEFVDSCTIVDGTEFAGVLMPSVKLITSDLFKLFEDHLKGCGSSYRITLIREKRRDLLKNIFTSIDGRLDAKLNRHRIVQLLTQFYDHANTETQRNLVDPKTFGISEFEQDIICESQSNIAPEVLGDSDCNVEKDENELVSIKSDKDINLSNDNGMEVTETGLEKAPIEQPEALEQSGTTKQEVESLTDENSTIINGQTVDVTGESEPSKQACVPEEKSDASNQQTGADKQPTTEQVSDESVKTGEAENMNGELSKFENKESLDHSKITEEEDANDAKDSIEKLAENMKEETTGDSKGDDSEVSEEVKPAIVVDPSNSDTKESDSNALPPQVQPSDEPQESPQLSTNNLTCIQEIEEVDETIGDVETAVVSLDVTIAIDEVDSQNATQDFNHNKPEQTLLYVKSESRLVSIKNAQILRNKVLSRLANIDPEFIRSSTNTPINYSSPGIPWNLDFISIEQFIQLTEFYWGTQPNLAIVEAILEFISDGYVETEYEKKERLREEWLQKLRTNQFRNLRSLYIRWDNDRAGYINREDFTNIITAWPRALEYTKLAKLPEVLATFQFLNEDIVTREEFFNILADTCLCLEEEHEFLEFLEFIEKSIKLTNEEKQRGTIRSTWLDNIIMISRTCGLSFDPIFKTALGCIYKDNEHHGLGKRAKCNVGTLEYIQGKRALYYVAASQDDQEGVVGKILKEEDKCVGFSVIKTGKMIHIPKILETKQPVHFFYPQRKFRDKERKGSFLCCPLLHPRGHVIGVLGIDTLTEIDKKDFIPHEISFFQGVAKTLGEAYSFVELRIKLVKILHSAFRWTLSKVSSISNITVYIVEDPPSNKADAGYIIRKVLTMRQGDLNPVEDVNAPRIFRNEDVFKEYLFKCADHSEPTTTETFGHLHWTIPVRDIDGFPMSVIDIEIGENELSKPDKENILWMARLVSIAVLELSQGYREPPMPHVLEAEGIDEESRLSVLFSRVLLTDLRNKVEKLDAEAYAEIKSYIDPPKVIHDVLKAVLYIFNPEKSEAYKQWRNCKQSINNDLTKTISTYDPTSKRDEVRIKELQQLLSIVPNGEVEKHGSLPAKYLHDWSMVCLSLLEHTARMQEAFGAKLY